MLTKDIDSFVPTTTIFACHTNIWATRGTRVGSRGFRRRLVYLMDLLVTRTTGRLTICVVKF